MKDFVAEIIHRCEIELREAIADHEAAYPNGDWKAANDRLGRVRMIADAALQTHGTWPVDKFAIGNDRCLALLCAAGTSEKAIA
jgi:hypothetical protein